MLPPGEPVSSRDATSKPVNNAIRVNRRRAKIMAEIERNRRGEYTVPTWVLAMILLMIIAGYAALIIFG